MVNNVRNNYEGFTSDKIKRDDAAYKALGRLRNPTSDNFEKMERSNQIQNFPINSKEITNTKVIFGPHLAGVRREALRCTPKRVDSDRVKIPRNFKLWHKSVTSVGNVFFVNGIPFLITQSRNIRFVIVKPMRSSTASQLSIYLIKACSFYAREYYND